MVMNKTLHAYIFVVKVFKSPPFEMHITLSQFWNVKYIIVYCSLHYVWWLTDVPFFFLRETSYNLIRTPLSPMISRLQLPVKKKSVCSPTFSDSTYKWKRQRPPFSPSPDSLSTMFSRFLFTQPHYPRWLDSTDFTAKYFTMYIHHILLSLAG